MSLRIRTISFAFSKNGEIKASFEGLKCVAIINNPGGNNAFAQLQLRVYGLSLAHMNQFSAGGASSIRFENIDITVLAGDVNGQIGQVFTGGLFSSYIDFSSAPDVAFVCAARAGLFQQAAPSASNSWKGSQNAESLVEALAKSIGFGFENNGAHAVIQNQYAYGSVFNQIQTICNAANLPFSIENNTVSIWSNGGTKNKNVVYLRPDNGLVGYPAYYQTGFIVKSIYNPLISLGTTVNLTSVINQANGPFPVLGSTHELSTLTPDGPWFTTAKLAPIGTYSVQ